MTTQPKKIFITTAIDYTNDVIHIGHAYEKVFADTIARYYRLKMGDSHVYFLTGTDEHGTTSEKAAKAAGTAVLDHVTAIAQKNRIQLDALNLSYDRFIRTTDADHKKIAQDFYALCKKNGYIYSAEYEGLYCEGCEAYKTLTELDGGKCPLHITREIQKYKEQNYFFQWSAFAEFLKDLLDTDALQIFPEVKKNEMLAFLANGLEDIPISRPKFKLPWGIEIPDDSDQVIYVWFDALINYFTVGSQTGFWDDDTKIIHFVGKDIARFHVLLWPAMLKSVGYRLPDSVCIHSFINLNGEKISKSRGNVIRPKELTDKYGVDVVRYYFLKYGPILDDVDISLQQLTNVYNGELADGLGNTVARLAKMAQNANREFDKPDKQKLLAEIFDQNWAKNVAQLRVDFALENIWRDLKELDKHINTHEPWRIQDKIQLIKILDYEVTELRKIALKLTPFMPQTAQKIYAQFTAPKIKTEAPLFPHI